ncbi:GNAT family N-acetyltransferase [Pseudoruegeria sp. HB172150]|uniref:GNAT family N-acetyltransferase n=1 Tax=Pseudoruegeria sp. HB172150 TaxID=2721164 RepID=UPI001557EF25|nr:GNAT family N-acetyltransferase [Pseudoruegeria sp. HB172150]
MTILKFRAVEERDLPEIHRILTAEHVCRGTMRLPLADMEMARKRMAPEPGVIKIAAMRDGGVAGIGVLVTYPGNPRKWHSGELDLVAVHPDHRGHGVGAAICVELLRLCDDWLGLQRVELMVWASNVSAIRLYERLGFELEGTKRNYVRRGSGYDDACLMARFKGQSNG